MTVATLDKKDIFSAISDSLLEHHYQEWKSSAVSDEIIKLNTRSVLDGREADKLLNLNSKRRWKHSEALVPGWMVSGIDPLTDEPTLQGVQLKPDNPPVGANGKPLKYLGAKEFEAAPLFLRNVIDEYWKSIIMDLSLPVIITEGAKKAGALLTAGYAAISIPGVSTCRKLGRLHQNLELFAKVGRRFYLCFDNDILYKVQVKKALIKLAAELAAQGSKVYIILLPEGAAKGCDDYIAAFGKENFDSLVENAATFEEWLEDTKSQELEEEEFAPKSKLAKNFKLIESAWGENLRYNSLTKEVELFGRELNEDEVRLVMALQFDVDVTSTDAQTIIRNLAKRDEYSPVVEYLNEVEAKFPAINTSILDNLASEYFGTTEEICNIYFKKFLVASVARARNPGCKVDNVLMLISPEQGKYKSTFFSVLFGDNFFSDQLGTDINNKDEKMKISQYWCLEWSEFDAIYKKKDVSSLKNFITNRTDTFRAPYARKDAKHPRPCVFVGTSNQTEILHDETGDRRFWPVRVLIESIPLDKVRTDRDKIWAAANKLYNSGFQWWLTKSEEQERNEKNKEFRFTSAWDESIEVYWHELGCPEFLPTDGILKHLGFGDYKEVKPGDVAELSKSMVRLGFQKSKNGRRMNGVLRRGWEKLNYEKNRNFDFGDATGVTGATYPETIDISTIQPVTPPVAPPVTGATYQEFQEPTQEFTTELTQGINNLAVTPVTPPATGVQQLESSDIKEVAPPSQVAPPNVIFNVGDFVLIDGVVDQVTENIGCYCRITTGEPWHYTRLEKVDPQVSSEFLKDCITSQDWEMLEELTSKWCQEFKKAAFSLLTNEEQRAIREMKPRQPQKSINLPILEVGQEYFSAINQQMVKVVSIQDGLEVCDCELNRKRLVCDFGDLRAIPTSQTLAVDLNDGVEILVGKYKGKKATISSQLCEHGPLFLKIEGVRASVSSKFKFWGHQLKAL